MVLSETGMGGTAEIVYNTTAVFILGLNKQTHIKSETLNGFRWYQ